MLLNLQHRLKLYKHHLTSENYYSFWEINENERQKLSLKYEIISLDFIKLQNKNFKKFKHNRYIKCLKCQRITKNCYITKKGLHCYCKPCHLLWRKKHYNGNYKQRAIKLAKAYCQKHPKKQYGYMKKCRSKNLKKRKEYGANWHSKSYKNNIIYKLKIISRSRVKGIFKYKNWKKNKKFKDYLGTTPELFKEYLEKQFTTKMTWKNMGIYWQLDHIIPIGLAKTPEDVYKLSHYTNFQPLSIKKHKKKTKNDIKKIRKNKIINEVNIS